MVRRHLYELLSEEQEPFSLQSFIDERRCQLRRPSSRALQSTRPPPSPPSSSAESSHQHHHHVKRHAPPASVSALRDPAHGKRSPPSQLCHRRAPSSASRFPAVFLLETAVRIQKQQHRQQQSNQKKRRRSNAGGNPSKSLHLGFLVSIVKRLVVRKTHLEIAGEEGGLASFKVSAVMDFLRWESCHGGNRDQGAMEKARHKRRGVDSAMGKMHYGIRPVGDRRNGLEGEDSQSCDRCKRDAAACRRGAGDWPRLVASGGPVLGMKASIWSPPRRHVCGSSPGGAPLVQQTPAASPRRPNTERQLFGGTSDDGTPKPSYYEQEKEQFSPVSVLDPPFDEEDAEDDRHGDDHEHPDLEEQEEQEDEEGDVDVELLDSFQRSLVSVQRTKQELLGRIRRFERLADLDPVQLDRRLAEEQEDGSRDGPGKVAMRVGEPVDTGELLDVCELVRAVLGGCCAGKIPRDMKRLVLDLADEEVGGDGPETVDASTTVERVRLRFEAWKGMGCNNVTIDMMVGSDVRREGQTWRRCPEQVGAVAAEVEASVSDMLVDELTEELHRRLHTCSQGSGR